VTGTRSAPARSRLEPVAEAAHDAIAWVRTGVAAEGLERRIAWIVVGVVLVLGPALFNLSRSESFTAQIQVIPREVGPFKEIRDPRYYKALTRDFVLRDQMAKRAGATPEEYAGARVVEGPRSLLLKVDAKSPDRAERLAETLGPLMATTSGRQIERYRTFRLADINAVLLERPRPPAAERLRLYRLRRDLRRLQGKPLERVAVAPDAARPDPKTWADRVADALPGSFPGRASPFWSAIAGLLLFGTLWAVAQAVIPPPGRSEVEARLPAGAVALRRRLLPPRGDVPPQVAEPVAPLAIPLWLRIAWIAALVATPLLTLWLIAEHGENVPFWDEWNLVALFQKQDGGRLGLGDFLAQHNEHRPVVPRTADYVTAHLTSWDLRVELYRNFAVAVATFVLIVVALRRTLDRVGFLAGSVLASLLVFSPVQWENWLWGWQLEWFLSNLAAVGALWALTFTIDRSTRRGLAIAIACGLVATFSLGQGLFVWPVGLLVLLLRHRPWRVWAGAGVLTWIVYFASWENDTGTGSKSLALERPGDFVEFVVLYLGRPLANSNATGKLVGLVLIAVFVAAATYVLRHRRDLVLVDRAALWLGLGLYTLMGALITGVSRLDAGVIAFSRYATMAMIFALAVMALLFVLLRSERIGSRVVTPERRRCAVAAIGVPLLLAALVNANAGVDSMERKGDELDAMAKCTRAARTPRDPCLRNPRASPYPEQFDWTVYLRRKGWAGY
jgi:hypothetical protein